MTVLSTLFAPQALLADGWARDVRIEIAPEGNIASIEQDASPGGCERIEGVVVPGLTDLHSHAFERALAGLRRPLRGLLARIGPDELRAIAGQLYVELLKGGYTGAVEFHHLHHPPGGGRYDDPALLAVMLHEAARDAGIGLTLLPALCMRGGFDGAPLEGHARRFALQPAELVAMLGRLERLFADDPERQLGVAVHSLGAVPPERLAELVEAATRGMPAGPLHIHLAARPEEVEDCLACYGRRPLRLLAEAVPLGPRWCLVHATHLDEDERSLLAASGAVAGRCPTSEASRGDGIFILEPFLARGGRFGIGSDHNLCSEAAHELRLLDYGQRLAMRRCPAAVDGSGPQCGAALFMGALRGGAQASARPVGRLAPGFRADLLVLDDSHPALCGREGDLLLDALVLASRGQPVRHVMVSGDWRIRDGAHLAEDAIGTAFRAAMRRLGA
ncbi:formimidoylglutamate deiminase [Geminicoccaceae bacterium 1502E]|nr:formimidoylglutamate deiminase [Geminicoccaceae bacterium 1502E]